MEHGFFHPTRGYWQATGEPSADILAAYPEGTRAVPLKPGADHDWIDGAWVHVPPAPTIADITTAVQAHLDAAARAAGYDDIRSVVTYADEPAVPKFQADGQAFRAWRSLVWAKCYELLAAGKPLTAAAVIAQLPQL